MVSGVINGHPGYLHQRLTLDRLKRVNGNILSVVQNLVATLD